MIGKNPSFTRQSAGKTKIPYSKVSENPSQFNLNSLDWEELQKWFKNEWVEAGPVLVLGKEYRKQKEALRIVHHLKSFFRLTCADKIGCSKHWSVSVSKSQVESLQGIFESSETTRQTS